MNIILSNTSNTPIYEQITNQIIEQIMIGQLREGEQLPSIRLLAKELHVSVITTKRAYEELEKKGFIHTIIGKGSFVSSQSKENLQQKQLTIIRNELKQVIHQCKKYNITRKQLVDLVEELYEEE